MAGNIAPIRTTRELDFQVGARPCGGCLQSEMMQRTISCFLMALEALIRRNYKNIRHLLKVLFYLSLKIFPVVMVFF
jgi:hypothetical protein